jgi:aspartyl-tRNA(Asn)/glutamyl-tRNA(Gln) amidotransferase subunit B
MKYTAVIGLEIHAELKTKTKIFCSCDNTFGGRRNQNSCPVCTAFPGTLPVLNREAVEMTIAAGIALGSEISKVAMWDRKNYFYPDLPKAYQISELYVPICVGGGLRVSERFIRLNHIHLEEDAGKLIHTGKKTLLDFNRAGVPLIEIVTEPDMCSAGEAVAFVEKVRRALLYAGVCDGKMEQGSLRCDANVSIMPENSSMLGTRTETKNLNSFRFIKEAIEYEIERQIKILESGRQVVQETRRYDEENGETYSMRLKENAHDYRYFPDPDIPPVRISDEEIERIRRSLPESPELRKQRYMGIFGLGTIDADMILARKKVADFFDATVSCDCDPKSVANLIKVELLRWIDSDEDGKIPICPQDFAKVLKLTAEGKLSQNGMKEAVAVMFKEHGDLDNILAARGLLISEDVNLLNQVVAGVLKANPKAVERYRSGDQKVFGFFMGQCTKELKEKAHPRSVQNALKKILDC